MTLSETNSPHLIQLVTKDLVEVSKTWSTFIPGVVVMSFYQYQYDRIVVELVKIPVSHRRQGYCGQILDEIIVIARAYNVEVWLQPSSSFGIEKNVLINMYEQYGFSLADDGWMKIK